MADDSVKWWQYQSEVLDYAARMHGEGYSWDAIAVHLYRRGQCPYYHPEFLGGAVLARRAANKRGEDRPPEISRDGRLPPPLPPRKPPPAIPQEEPGPPADLRADFAEQFRGKAYPGDAEATLALLRAQRRRRG
jgi:hypothetical protein